MNAVADVRYLQPTQFDQIEPRFDAEFGVYWATMNPQPRPPARRSRSDSGTAQFHRRHHQFAGNDVPEWARPFRQLRRIGIKDTRRIQFGRRSRVVP